MEKTHAGHAGFSLYAEFMTLNDKEIRKRALDPGQSFIVQAPAGSGKTELLVQRFLRLLSVVKKPEEILCITFTRKAAQEMRTRVLNALDRAEKGMIPETPHEVETLNFAKKAMEKNKEMHWDVLENPSRLKIQTIDSLCSFLTRHMPFLSGFGDQMAIAKDAELLYTKAARATLEMVNESGPYSNVVANALCHLDNSPQLLERLLVSMLARRDQWLNYTHEDARDRSLLENNISKAATSHFEKLKRSFPENLKKSLVQIASFAAKNVNESSKISLLKEMTDLPATNIDALCLWEGIAELLLVKDKPQARSSNGINKTIGFPSDKKEPGASMRKTMQTLVEDLANYQDVVELLDQTRKLPDAAYADDQWEILDSLLHTLKLAASHLLLVFEEHTEVDFIEVAQAALNSLGTDESPTDLLLRLDYLVQHILVDEFQDTSFTQFNLLKKLTTGWMPGDGKTLFLVGDPMQSIYRFREAQVGLFLHAKNHGINSISLEPLDLSANFRSQSGIVDWVNATFSDVFLQNDNSTIGAVHYAPMQATKDYERAPVIIHPYIQKADETEAEDVLNIITQCIKNYPEERIAVLVRSRDHIARILTKLREKKITFKAEEIEELSKKPVVQELFTLTRALFHLGDSIAWLSVLRARWCGLMLNDLYILCHDAHSPVLQLLHDVSRIEKFSDDAKARLQRIVPILDKAFAHISRRPLRDQVRACWIALAGPACIDDDELPDAEAFFSLLDSIDSGGMPDSMEALYDMLSGLYAKADPYTVQPIEVMTIHKAKGLEFDTVILPGLGKRTKGIEKPLIRWIEHPDYGVLLAPVERKGSQDKDRTYHYIKMLEDEMDDQEERRVLYVACTRAKKQLHLLGHAELDKKPSKDALLSFLWEKLKHQFEQIPETPAPEEAAQESHRKITRIRKDWQMISIPSRVTSHGIEKILPSDLAKTEYAEWLGEPDRFIGTVVHRIFEKICIEGIHEWDKNPSKHKSSISNWLKSLGVAKAELDHATDSVFSIIKNTLEDPRGTWILSPHQDSKSEYRISGMVDNKLVHASIDRTFVQEDVRWIIDYKTSSPSGQSLEEFIAQEYEKYRSQLEMYARLIKNMETHQPIMLGLYFPCLPAWKQWEFNG